MWGPWAVTHQDSPGLGDMRTGVQDLALCWHVALARELGSVTLSPGDPVRGCPIPCGHPIFQ